MMLSVPSHALFEQDGKLSVDGAASDGRRTKRAVHDGMASPSGPPARTQAARQAELVLSRPPAVRGFWFIVSGVHGAVAVKDTITSGDNMVGLLFCPTVEVHAMLKRAALSGELSQSATEANQRDRSVRLLLWWSGDGVTPTNTSLCCSYFRFLDPSREVFASGASPLMRLIEFWGSEHNMRDFAAMRNRVLSELVHSDFSLHTRLSFRVAPRSLAADNKFMAIELCTTAGVSDTRCFVCDLNASKWGRAAQSQYKLHSVATLAERYLRVLFEMFVWFKEQPSRPKLADVQARYKQRCSQSGSMGFPLVGYGNAAAMKELLRVLAGWLGRGQSNPSSRL